MFTAKERRVFTFHDGLKEVARDPQRLFRRLESLRPANWKELVDACRPPGAPADRKLSAEERAALMAALTPEDSSAYLRRASPALDALTAWICEVFGVRPVQDDGTGLTEEELFALLDAFQRFVAKKNDAGEDGPSSSPSTPAPTPSAAADPPTKPTSGCGCGGTPA